MYHNSIKDIESSFAAGWKARSTLSIGCWVNPAAGVLGALVLGGYLLAANPVPSVATGPASPSTVETAVPEPAQLVLPSNTVAIADPSVARGEVTSTSTIDLLKATSGAVLGFALTMIGAWLGVRNAQRTPIDEPAYGGTASTVSKTVNPRLRGQRSRSRTAGDAPAVRIGLRVR